MENQLNWLMAAARRGRRIWRSVRQRLGSAGVVGVTFLAAATSGLVYAPQLLNEADSMQVAGERTRERLADIDRELAADPGSSRQLDRFRTWLPRFEQSTADLRRLFEIADSSQIKLLKGEYALKQDHAHRLSRLDVVLPIRDNYQDIRGFVAATLDALPHVSLAEMRMERPAASVEPIDAYLRFTLFYGDH